MQCPPPQRVILRNLHDGFLVRYSVRTAKWVVTQTGEATLEGVAILLEAQPPACGPAQIIPFPGNYVR